MNIHIASILDMLVTKLGENNVCFAGGAIRDYYLDKPIKDYDIFVRDKELLWKYKEVYNWLIGYGFNSEVPKATRAEYAFSSTSMKLEQDPEFELNLILVTTEPLKYVLDTFDFGICHCWFDNKTMDYVFDSKFERDVRDKTLTFWHKPGMTDNDISRAFMRHLPRLKEKYPEYEATVGIGPRRSALVI